MQVCCDLCRFRAVWGGGTTQHRGQATRNTGGRSEYSISFLAPLNDKEGIRSLHHKIQSCWDWSGGGRGRVGLCKSPSLPACRRTVLATFLSARKGFSYCCLLCVSVLPVEFLSWFHSKAQADCPNRTRFSQGRRGLKWGRCCFLIPKQRGRKEQESKEGNRSLPAPPPRMAKRSKVTGWLRGAWRA